MNRILIINAKGIVQHNRSHVVRGIDMQDLPVLENGWLMIEGDKICDIGHMDEPFHSPVNDVIDRVPQLGSRAAYAKQALRDKLLEHTQYASNYGDDMPEIADWKWNSQCSAGRRGTSTEGDKV